MHSAMAANDSLLLFAAVTECFTLQRSQNCINNTHNRFTALWILSGTTRVSQHQKKHSPTHTHRGHQISLSTSSIYFDPWHTPYSIHALYSLFPQSLSKLNVKISIFSILMTIFHELVSPSWFASPTCSRGWLTTLLISFSCMTLVVV